MFAAIVTNGQIANTGKLKDLFPNTSFPASGPNDEWMMENNVKLIVNYKNYDSSTQKLEIVDPYIDGDIVYDVNIVDLSADEISAKEAIANDRAAQVVRDHRNKLLADSDWTQMNDSPLSNEDKTVWATYRQELRYMSDLASWPNIAYDDWPVAP